MDTAVGWEVERQQKAARETASQQLASLGPKAKVEASYTDLWGNGVAKSNTATQTRVRKRYKYSAPQIEKVKN